MKKNLLKKTMLTLITGYCLFFTGSAITFASTVYDFDGDGKTDPIVRRSESDGNQFKHTWFVLGSRDGFSAVVWGRTIVGSEGDNPTGSGDYDGDGKWDIVAVRRILSEPRPIIWYVLNSSNNTFTATQWGLTTDMEIPQDYDGDGKTDVAVYRGGWWYILNSSDGSFRAEKFGQDSDSPQRGDYDGDGKADLTVRRSGVIYTLRSSDRNWQGTDFTNLFTGAYFVPGDYDGDGKTDYAFWKGQCDFGQGALWTIIRSSDNQYTQQRFGLVCDDVPASGDYDGDGKTDIAVYRQGKPNSPPSYFYILQSRDGFKAIQWGRILDEAVAYRQNTP